MILYLDTSALVKLVVQEPGSDAVDRLAAAAEYAVSSVIAYAECRSAIARAAKAERVDAATAVRSLDRVWDAVQTLDVDLRLSARAGALAGRHLLRGVDALHLASALDIATPEIPVAFATFDRGLARAARAERLSTPIADVT
ncbi:MAG TPA: type II toxin-antitoxin system VapC family toxin [Candidatus Limnocylindria bacterium]|nr:type II toxin-antitoxin system VapC family toxin [Candidatus Limnocylindria bacterium]